MNRYFVPAISLAAALLLVACGSKTPAEEEGNFTVAFSEKERQTSLAPDNFDTLVPGNNRFALSLYSQLASDDGNMLISPYSISVALGMAYSGAAGETAEEMAETLHFTLPPDELHKAFNALQQVLEARGDNVEDDEKFTLEIANSLWGQEGFGFEQSFLDTLAEYYGSGMRLVDYGRDHEEARMAINEWVERNTADRIKELLEPGLIDPSTLLIQVNATYFKASWQHEFTEGRTAVSGFRLKDGSYRAVPTMAISTSFNYAEGDGYQAIRLPYVSAEGAPELSMVVLLPEEGRFDEIEASLTDEKLEGVRADLSRKEQVNLFLPKFQFESSFSLPEALIDLGMEKAFDGRAADFSRMHGQPPPAGIYIDEVVHKTFVSVDEQGTEAAASTAVITVFVGAPEETFVFRANRPFIFFIQDDDTGSILFMGRVLNPCAGSAICESGDFAVDPSDLPPTPTPGPGRRLNAVGPVTAYSGNLNESDNMIPYKISVDVALRDTKRPIDFTPRYLPLDSCAPSQPDEACLSPRIDEDAESTMLINYIDRNQFLTALPWTVQFGGSASDDFILEGDEQATITIWLLRRNLSVADVEDPGALASLIPGLIPLGPGAEFTIELIPDYTRRLIVQRRLPIKIEATMDLK